VRTSREATAATKLRILGAAARMLRERGIEATAIADVMQAAGMKHGGFYKHFESKQDMVRQAIATAFGERTAAFDARKEKEGEAAAIRAYVETYLSQAHVDHPGYGCPVAGFGADAGRDRQAYAGAFADGMEALVERLGGAAQEQREAAVRRLCLMVGAMIVARASGASPLREEALRSVEGGEA
jgi:TetR/AcrR family transcriptional repressor of nem operon